MKIKKIVWKKGRQIAGDHTDQDDITVEEFQQWSYKKRLRLKKKNPILFDYLIERATKK